MLAAGCADLQTEDQLGEAGSELSVADWSAPVLLAPGVGVGASGAAPATLNGTTIAVSSGGSSWAKRIGAGSWTAPAHISSAYAYSTQRLSVAGFGAFIYMFRVLTDHRVYMTRFDPSTETWSQTTQLPYVSLATPAVAVFQNQLWLFGNSPDTYQMWSATMTDRELFSQAVFIDGKYTSEPASAAVFMNRLYLAHRQLATDNIIYARFDGTTWTPNQFIFAGVNGSAIIGTEPVIGAVNGFLHILYRGTSNASVMWSYFDTCEWSPEVSIGQTTSVNYGLAPGGPGLVLTTRSSGSAGYVSEYTAPPGPRLPPNCSVINP